MEARGSYVLVGLFVLVMGVMMVASLFWLAGWGRRSDETYLVLMTESVSGLTVDAPVKYRGVDVGRVAALDLRPDDPEVIQLTLSIHPDAPILADTRAQLEFQGLTGLAFINLLGGTRDALPLKKKPGQEHRIIESAPSILARLDSGVSQLLVSVTETSDQIAGILSEVDRAQLGNLVENLDRLTKVLADSSQNLGGAIANAERFLDSAAETGERLPELVNRIDVLTDEWSTTTREVREMAASGSSSLERMTHDVSGSVQLLTADLRQLVGRLEQVATKVEEDPSMFLYGRTIVPRGPGE